MDPSSAATSSAPDDKWAAYAAALAGPRQDYYLEHFKRIDSGARLGLSWNWAAMFFTFGWLRYRRMYACSWAYFLVSTPVLILLGSEVVADACTAEVAGAWITPGRYLVVLALGYLVPALYANRLYFRFVTRRIAAPRARESHGDAPEQSLHKRASTAGYWDPVTATIVGGLVALAIAASLPMHHHSGPRYMVAVLVLEAATYKTDVAEFFAANKRLPAGIEEIGDVPRPTESAKSLDVEPNGVIRAVAGFAPLEGRSILLVPGIRGDRMHFSCRSDDIPDACLPVECRKKRPG